MDVTIKITRSGELPGSLGWLSIHAAEIKLGQTTEKAPAAWLLDHDKGVIDCLVLVDNDYGEMRLSRETSEYDADGLLSTKHPYTDAAWEVMERLIEIASEQLGEPAELAKAVVVQIVPKDPLLAAMMKAAKDEPAARSALIDYVSENS